ncbi:MAG: hypothetical protein ACK54P_08665, partial [Bacteroidota bacterium]
MLTSIDKEHRHRVGELLMQEFGEYQIVLTTHDEYWFELLASISKALGVEGNWSFQKLEGWNIDTGPSIRLADDAWVAISERLDEGQYRSLGGPFRVVLEDFMKRVAAKLELRVRFKYDGKYTAGDFIAAGIQSELQRELKRAQSDKSTEIETEIIR